MTPRLFSGHPIAIFAPLGALSGAISGLSGGWLPQFNLPAFFYGIPPDRMIPMRPAIVFAIALAIAASLTATRRIIPLLTLMASVFVGWWVVMEYAAAPGPLNTPNWAYSLLHWFGCGLVGALFVGAAA